MSAPRCLFNSAVALRRVFLSNALAPEATSSLRRPTLPPLPLLSHHQPRRTLIYSKKKPWETAEEDAEEEDDGGPKTNLSIKSTMIYLRDEETGKLGDPVETRAVLRSLDLRLQLLMQVAESVEMEGGKWPVCRVVDRREVEQREKAKAREARAQKVMEKEMELNWAIDKHDLDMKLRQLRAFLDKGFRVDVTLLTKKKKGGGREASADEAKKLLADVDEMIAGVPGVKEVKGREGLVGGTYKIVLQGLKVKAEKKVWKKKGRESAEEAEVDEAKVAEADVADVPDAK